MRSPALGVPAAMLAVLLSGCIETVFFDDRDLYSLQDTWVDPNEPDPWSQVASTDEPETSEREASSCTLKSGFNNNDRTRLSYAAVTQLASSVGVSCGRDLVKAVALAAAESGRFQYAYLRNRSCQYDRGLWQINSYWHPEISAACALSASCNARGMVKISSYGTKWSPWWTYVNGKHLPYMSQARAAQETVCAE